jgi:hypothetical protein
MITKGCALRPSTCSNSSNEKHCDESLRETFDEPMTELSSPLGLLMTTYTLKCLCDLKKSDLPMSCDIHLALFLSI